jgi:hypothetical protein
MKFVVIIYLAVAVVYPGKVDTENWEAYKSGDVVYLNIDGRMLVFYHGVPSTPLVMIYSGSAMFYRPFAIAQLLEVWVETDLRVDDYL